MTTPIIGNYYHFFEEGNFKINKHFICRCERIITLEESKKLLLNYRHEKLDSLYNIFQQKISKMEEERRLEFRDDASYLIFSKDTDIFVEISCPKFDSERLWCARTMFEEGFRSLNIQNSWQDGIFNTNDELLDFAICFYPEFKDNYLNKTY